MIRGKMLTKLMVKVINFFLLYEVLILVFIFVIYFMKLRRFVTLHISPLDHILVRLLKIILFESSRVAPDCL